MGSKSVPTAEPQLAPVIMQLQRARTLCFAGAHADGCRTCALQVDTNGVVSAYLEERFSPGINFVLSAELDHLHSNYKFGFGVVAGE